MHSAIAFTFTGLVTGLALLVLASDTRASDVPSPLAGSEWALVELNGAPLPVGADIFVAFRGDGRAAGSGGCNRFTAGYVSGGDDLAFSPIAATRMACREPVMARESAFFAAIEAVASIADRSDDALVLADAQGRAILRLRRRDRD